LNQLFEKYAIKGEQRFVLAGQNTGFDYRFFQHFWNKHKAESHPEFNHYFNKKVTYDLMHLTKPLHKNNHLDVANVKLGTIMEAFDIKPEGDLHDALTDIKGTFGAFNKTIEKWISVCKKDKAFFNENANDNVKHLFKKLNIKI